MKQNSRGTNSEYNQHVGLKYQLYNSLFLTLPLGGVKDVGILIPVLAETCRTKLQQGETPKKIIEQFLTEKLILKISGQNELLEKNESIKESIALREETVLPLLVIQQYALMKLRENDLKYEQKETLEKIIIRSLFGNINASRNSA